MAHQRIPVVVLTGFLGSGKTTLLNHLLANSAGTRIGVVVNDFGQINIDAMTVAGQVDSMVSLGNGCLCCAVDASDLDEMLTKLAEPSARIDVIVIEASGLADPQSIVRMLLFSENPGIAYGGLVEVVDAAEFNNSRARHPELDRHLRFADLVVLNKTDRVRDLTPIRALIDSLSTGKPVLPVSHGAVDPGLLFDQVVRPDDAVRQLSFDELVLESDDHSQHAHALYSSVSFSSAVPMHPQRFARFLDERPAGLYRLKGSVYFGVSGHTGKFSVQTVGNYLRYARSGWARGEPRGTELVLIGTDLDEPMITKRLESCQRGADESVDANAMLAVLRYLE